MVLGGLLSRFALPSKSILLFVPFELRREILLIVVRAFASLATRVAKMLFGFLDDTADVVPVLL